MTVQDKHRALVKYYTDQFELGSGEDVNNARGVLRHLQTMNPSDLSKREEKTVNAFYAIYAEHYKDDYESNAT